MAEWKLARKVMKRKGRLDPSTIGHQKMLKNTQTI
jgi:hypothetical protein